MWVALPKTTPVLSESRLARLSFSYLRTVIICMPNSLRIDVAINSTKARETATNISYRTCRRVLLIERQVPREDGWAN